jgi:hypothetical protein
LAAKLASDLFSAGEPIEQGRQLQLSGLVILDEMVPVDSLLFHVD